MKYIVAVSGGVDSIVMLDMLARESDKHELVVAHVNHGIRPDSDEDEALVRQLAVQYGLEFVCTRLSLGARTSEDTARQKRHAWLQQQMHAHGAERIATAHHEDDVIETMVINMLRGTGWRGLCSLRETNIYMRPLLTWGKMHIATYAIEHNLLWREDSTNNDLRYRRNYLRSGVLARLSPQQKQQFISLYQAQCALLPEVNSEIMRFTPCVHNRYFMTMLDQSTACELLRAWLPEPLERRRLLDLWLFAKTAKPGSRWSFDKNLYVVAQARDLVVTRAEN